MPDCVCAGIAAYFNGDPFICCEEVTLTNDVIMDIINIQNY
jgi:hypothetical protein